LSTNRPRLTILAGIPGSGKSTWAKNFLPDAHYVSSDDIREQLGDVYDQTRNGEVFSIFHADIAVALAQGKDVVADSTALDARARSRLTAIAFVHGASTHLILFSNINPAVKRNQQRERVVPQDAMERMLDKFEKTLLVLPQEQSFYDAMTVISDTRIEPSVFEA
jgi:predicted kinase